MAATWKNPPQAFLSSYAPRIRTFGNSLLTTIIPQVVQVLPARTTKRGTTAINYAEDGYDDDDFEDSEGPRQRPTGLRSLRREENGAERPGVSNPVLGKELVRPVELQGIWRDWMGKPKKLITEKQHQVQSALPLTLIPIRIDLDLLSFRPDAPLPTPSNSRDFGIDDSLPAYRQPEPTPAFRLKDAFLWNLHEALMTPDQFAKTFVDELDLPQDRKPTIISHIANQIRQQLEDYAGVALHPLFQSGVTNPVLNGAPTMPTVSAIPTQANSPAPTPLDGTEGLSVAVANSGASTPAVPTNGIAATAEQLQPADELHDPDDAYRCIVTLSVNLLNRLYTDKFEWSLLHPPGLAEQFAKQTCADLGLGGEWVSAVAHSIYEAVLRLKKEPCENGGMLIGYGEIDNDAAMGVEAGWRYDPEHLADQWEPKVEVLSKEEIEKREGDRERQLRRVRRETARVSSTAYMGQPQGDYFNGVLDQDQPMGRGERSKKKRRFRSLSPLGRDTPEAGVSGYGGGVALRDDERRDWRCTHCQIWGNAVWAVRDGPNGPKSLCHNCGFLFEQDKKLPPWSKDLFANDAHYVPARR